MSEEIKSKDFNKNMLRDRAEKVPPVTDEMWSQVSEFNRSMVEEFLEESTHLSKQSQKQYKSALRIFYYWVYETLKDKPIYDIKKKDYLRFQNSLIRRGMSSNGIKIKRSAVSSLNKYLINFYEDEDSFKTFRNFVEGVPNPTPNKVYNKIPLSKEECELIIKTLEEDKQWQVLAAFKFLYYSGCRRAELLELKKEVVTYEPLKDKEGNPTEKYKTHLLRTKGGGEQGEVRALLFDDDVKHYMQKWLDFRGEDDCEYMFTSSYGNKVEQLDITTPNYWFSDIISDIVGRRTNVHLMRGTRATHILEDGKDIKVAQKLLGHKDVSTTQGFYDLRDDDDDLDEL